MSDATIESLQKENLWLRDLLQQVSVHFLECPDDDWICSLCGKTTPIEVEDITHEEYCPLHKKK